MTKEEKIKEDWGEYYACLSNKTKQYILSNNGQVNVYLLPKEDKDILLEDNDIRKYDSDFICTKTDEGTKFMFKPKSLQGIENNNGWIKIESEADLPNTHLDVLMFDSVNQVSTGFWDNLQMCFKNKLGQEYKFITHYQPIEKPKPPIY